MIDKEILWLDLGLYVAVVLCLAIIVWGLKSCDGNVKKVEIKKIELQILELQKKKESIQKN